MVHATINLFAATPWLEVGSKKFMILFLLLFAKTKKSYLWHFLQKKSKNWLSKIFRGPRALGEKWKKIKKKIFEMKLKIWNPYGLRITHTKFESNQRQNFFSVSKGGPFGVFLIFRVSMWRHWLTIMDIKGGIDSLECWNSDVNGCLNNQTNCLETNFWH